MVLNCCGELKTAVVRAVRVGIVVRRRGLPGHSVGRPCCAAPPAAGCRHQFRVVRRAARGGTADQDIGLPQTHMGHPLGAGAHGAQHCRRAGSRMAG